MTKNKRHPITEQTKTIWRLSNQGLPQRKITKMLGVNRGVVGGAVNRGRKSGDCIPKPRTKNTVRNQSPVNFGTIGRVMDALSVDQLDWLFRESEDLGCVTTAELITELVRDAYEDAMAKEKRND